MTGPSTGLTDRIEIRGLELLLYCGVLPEEQERRQPLRVDLDLHLDLVPAGASDDLGRTIDYGAVANLLAARLADERFRLVERLAARIAELILVGDLTEEQVDAVTVTVTKLRPPIALNVDTAGVRIHRAADRAAGSAIDCAAGCGAAVSGERAPMTGPGDGGRAGGG
jgi:dihydroneopterin aldolase